jgi:CHAT domain-containing protein
MTRREPDDAHDDRIPEERIEEELRKDLAALAAARGNGQRFTALGNLSATYLARYRLAGREPDLDSAISHLRQALALLPPGDRYREVRADTTANLAVLLSYRPSDHAAARAEQERLRRSRPPGAAEPPEDRGHRGTLALSRYQATGDRALLQEALADLRAAVRGLPGDSPEQRVFTVNLALALQSSHTDATGDDAELDEAVRLYSLLESSAAPAGSEAEVPGLLAALRTNLAAALLARYRAAGDPRDLERSRTLGRQAGTAPGGWATAVQAAANAAAAALASYDRTGGLHALEQALAEVAAVLDATPAGAAPPPALLISAANLHRLRYAALADRRPRAALDSLHRSVRLARDALAAPALPAETAAARALLGMCLFTLHTCDRVRFAAELDEAADQLLRACRDPALAPDVRATATRACADVLAERAARDGAAAGYEDAVGLLTGLAGHGSPAQAAMSSGGLARLLLSLAKASGRAGHRDRARQVARAACADLAGLSTANAFALARLWGDTEWDSCVSQARAGRWDREGLAAAAEAYRTAIQLLHTLSGAQLLRTHKEFALHPTVGITARAAYALAAAGTPAALGEAVEALETGRALMLSEALEREGADLAELSRRGLAGLRRRYEDAAAVLQRLQRRALAAEGTVRVGRAAEAGRDPAPSVRDEIEEADREWRQVVGEIRRVEGFADFLRPPVFAELAALVTRLDRPVVYLCAGELGGLALLLRPGRPGEVSTVQLPRCDRRWERRVAAAWTAAAAEDDEETCDDLSELMWSDVAEPLTAALDGADEIVLIPAGLLALLPLHAAGRRDPAARSGRRHLLDHCAVRYAPTLRAAAAALDRCRGLPDDGLRLLAVAEPLPVSAAALPDAAAEAAAACCWFPDRVAGVLRGPEARRQRVLDLLADATVHHFAGHAFADLEAPLDGGLLMAGDETLTVRDVLGHTGFRSRLFTLSACRTGVPDTALPDEAVSLATALVQAGAAGVVASLWAVGSAATTALMARFYQHWRLDGLPPAQALRRAQLWFRDSTNAEKHAALPTVGAFAPPPDMTPAEHEVWAAERQDASGLWWSAFFLTGG